MTCCQPPSCPISTRFVTPPSHQPVLPFLLLPPASGPQTAAQKITLDDATALALKHTPPLLAARTTIAQSQANEVTANLRPNPNFFIDWEYLPIFSHPQDQTISQYLQAST